jgi:hypothetical protein
MNTQTHKISKHSPSIFQGRLNLAAASKPHIALAVEYPMERMIMRVLVAFLIMLAFGYLYFVAASVLNIMARKEALSQSAQIEGTIGSLEGQYFALSQSITPQSAVTLGLTPITVQNTDYVDRPGHVGIADTIGQSQI